MGRKYKSNPISEAVCEIQFDSDSPWDLVFPGLIYDQVRDIFPKRRSMRHAAIDLTEEPERFLRIEERIQFIREDEHTLLQIGPQIVAINQLKPYLSWEDFRPSIERGLQTYCNVVQPTGIHRIALRYINRIVFPKLHIKLEDYFEFYPHTGTRLPAEHSSFIVGIQLPFEESRDLLKLELQSGTPEQTGNLPITLDLNYFLINPGVITIDQVHNWIEQAHQHLENTFEACITDQLRALFEDTPL